MEAAEPRPYDNEDADKACRDCSPAPRAHPLPQYRPGERDNEERRGEGQRLGLIELQVAQRGKVAQG
jgi:hypothetical protein